MPSHLNTTNITNPRLLILIEEIWIEIRKKKLHTAAAHTSISLTHEKLSYLLHANRHSVKYCNKPYVKYMENVIEMMKPFKLYTLRYVAKHMCGLSSDSVCIKR